METQYFNVKEHVIETSYIREYPRALAGTQEDDLQLHIKQYVPKQNRGVKNGSSKAITIIGAHACGFPKELYEPLWDELYAQCSKVSDFEIAGIWIADVAWQGQSCVLNEHSLGNDPSWYDHCRDLLHMINVFRKQMPRPIVGIGHSMGGTQLTNLALIHPRLFASLILIDPVISLGDALGTKEWSPTSSSRFGLAWSSSYRKDLWSSREQAAATFKKIPLYKTWDSRVFDLWVKYGLRDLPTALYPEPSSESTGASPVTLTTPKTQEIWTLLRPNYLGQGANGKPVTDRENYSDVDPESKFNNPFYRPEIRRTYQKLPHLRPPTFYILGGESLVGTREEQQSKVPITGTGIGGSGGVKAGQVGHVFLDGIGHLVPMDAPAQSAEFAQEWLRKSLNAWFKTEADFHRLWNKTPKREKLNLSKEWLEHIGPAPRRGNKPKANI